jgi:hypothetical protein
MRALTQDPWLAEQDVLPSVNFEILPNSSSLVGTWEKQVLSARGFKRVGSHSEYAV